MGGVGGVQWDYIGGMGGMHGQNLEGTEEGCGSFKIFDLLYILYLFIYGLNHF